MSMLKWTVRLLMLLSIMGLLSGCWDNKDINHRTLPLILGVSLQDHEYKIIMQIPELVHDSVEIKMISESGKTINQAIDKISVNLEKQVDLLHIKVIILERKLAERGMKDAISGFMRSEEISDKAYIVICDEDLNSFFEHLNKTNDPKGMTLYNFFEKNAGWNPQIAISPIWQVYRSVHSYTRDVAIPMIKAGKSTICDYTGSAVIKNGKMIERISPDETLLFNAFNEQSTQGKIEVMNHASVLVVSNSLKHTTSLQNNKPYMQSRLKLKVVILETRGNPTSAIIKQEIDKLLTERFQRLFSKIQKSKADIFGIGQHFRNKIPREELVRWRTDYFPNLQLSLKIVTDIQNEGYLKIRAD